MSAANINLGAPVTSAHDEHQDMPINTDNSALNEKAKVDVTFNQPTVAPQHDELHPPQPHDELHPSTSVSPNTYDQTRRQEELVDAEKETVTHEASAVTGIMFPAVPAAMTVVPTVLVPEPSLDTPPASSDPEKAAQLDGVTATPSLASEKRPSLRSSADSNLKQKQVVAAPTPKKRRLPFSKRKKELDTEEKKAKQKEDEANAIPPVGMFQLFRFATPFERFCDVIGLILAAAAGATQPLMTLIFGRFTTSFTNFGIIQTKLASDPNNAQLQTAFAAAKHELRIDSGHNALYLMAIGLGMFACTWSYMFIWNWTGEVNAKRVRERYLRAVLRQDIAYFDDLGAGEVATRIQTDCHLIQEGTSEKVALVVQYLATFVTGFALAYARSWRLALALSSLFPVIVLTGVTMMTIMTRFSTKTLEATAKAGSLAEEVIGSIRTVQAFGKAKVLGANFDEHIDLLKTGGKGSAFVEAGGIATMFFSIYAAYALAFFYGGILVTQGRANAGIVINVFMSILIGSFSMAMLAPEMQTITKARAAAAKLFATIARVPAIDSADPGGLKPDTVEGMITFENVKFHYPSRQTVPILKGLTTVFEAGHTVALVGASGSGKSTVVSLVERFYDPTAGVVKLDGRDIRSLNLKWLRQQIGGSRSIKLGQSLMMVGLVSQEPTLFATTVRGNVEHGLIGSKWENVSPEEKFERVKKACVDANAHDFIMKLPAGYDTMVGERGMLLSGGQKQRVAIARAIVSDPRILLLDEATSALDTQSEGIVQDALDKASRGRTTITIAHRLSTIKDADKILVMGSGEILEEGTHYSLLANESGPYAQLVLNQKLSQVAAVSSDQDASASDEALDKLPPGSPVSEKFPGLMRAATGRSMASAMMEDIQAKRQADDDEDDKIPTGAFKMYARLFRINSDQKWQYITGFIGAICAGMVFPALSILYAKAITDFQIQDLDLLKHALTEKSRYYFITAVVACIAILVQISGFSGAGWALSAKLRSMSFAATMRHDIEWFDEDKHSTGAVTSDLSDLPQRVQGLFGTTMGSIVQAIATLVGGCVIGLAYGPLLALIGIACIPLLVSGGYVRLKVVVLKDQRMKKIHAGSAQMASEAAGAVRTVASLTREDDVDRLYSQALEGPLRTSIRSSVKSQALYAASQGMSFLIIALVFYIGALWIISGRYGTESFFTVLTSVIFASIQAGNVFTFVPDASKANSAMTSIFRLLDYDPEVDQLSTEGIYLNHNEVKGHIRLEGIHFRYPTRPGVRVLRDLTIDVAPGTYVALVGPSGCGKSTTIQMIERFYDPLIGRVTLDGVDVRDLNPESYRSQMALVSQEPTLYAGTVRFNILLGANKPMEEVTEEEIIQACKNANIYDFVMSLPDGFDTQVGGKGSQLSGGQKQRIAIARALIRNPKVLLLDEATSALDSQSERVVQDALDRAAKGRTTIAIAHRLSTIQKADVIYCFADGRVAEKGTHAELLAKKGAYFELVQMQNLSRVQ
ncbi:multidrug resistance protein 1 [Naematelia encephala]|uniref:Multidrug resistance protein 1 n=1 Tax=Naematelia encephala TaxID=71784 RepID=A0A1Y2BNX9_9TREE|nr:multidrug resistance protein 1 [Naematelia encephala]